MYPDRSGGLGEAEAAKLDAAASSSRREAVAFAVLLIPVVLLAIVTAPLPDYRFTAVNLIGVICFGRAFSCALDFRLYRFAARRIRGID